MSTSERRVVITGMGLISPLGNSVEALWQSVSTRKSGVNLIQRLPGDHLPSDIAGEAWDFSGEIDDFGPLEKKTKRGIKKASRLMCREIQMGVAASQLALNHSGLDLDQSDPERIGTMFGSDYIISEPSEFVRGVRECLNNSGEFDFEDWGEKGKPGVEPLWLLKYLPNMPASHVAIHNDLRGPSNSITVREASSNLAIAEGTTTIRRGSADRIVAGATGSRVQTLRTLHVSLQEQLADRHSDSAGGDPAKASRPYDKDRTGIVLGEGAGILVLEEMQAAEARGATVYGEVLGYGSSAVADIDGVADFKTAFLNSIHGALATSQLNPGDVGHIHGHGSGAIRCDREEAQAIREVFGQDVPVTSLKSYMGNLGAGSGAVELIASLVGLQHKQIIPTLNFESGDPESPLNVVQEPTATENGVVLNLNVTPQGQASAVLVQAF